MFGCSLVHPAMQTARINPDTFAWNRRGPILQQGKTKRPPLEPLMGEIEDAQDLISYHAKVES